MAYQETLDEAISLAAVAATSFHASTSAAAAADAQNREATALCDALKQLLEASSRLEVVGHLSSENVALNEFLSLVPFILTSSQADASLRSRLLRVLFQIALYNRPLRRRMCSAKLELCAPVWQALRTSVREQLGPQNMIDILRLLQVLTYERTLQLGVWVNDLISFLLTEIVREQETEWMPFCMAILCNLASRSKTVCTRIRSSSQYKPLARRLLKLLAHDSRMVVISALVLVGFLDDKIRDTVYCKVNVEQTLQCVFNVLILGGNELMTRHVAADLLQRITITPAHASTSLAPELTAIGSDLTTFPYFARSIQKIGALLVTLDPRSEEMLKAGE